ncbi:MAG: lytic transglycosylase domain-containing protein [bacterium]
MNRELNGFMDRIDPTTWIEARRAHERAVQLYLLDTNVVLIDLGFRVLSSTGGRMVPELTVRFHVRKKMTGEVFEAFARKEPRRVIDSEKIGFPVDVVESNYSLDPHSIRPIAKENLSPHASRSQGCGLAQLLNFGLEPGTLPAPLIPQLGMPVRNSNCKPAPVRGVVSGLLGCAVLQFAGKRQVVRHLIHLASEHRFEQKAGFGTWWFEASSQRAVGVHFARGLRSNCCLAWSLPPLLRELGLRGVPVSLAPEKTKLKPKAAAVVRAEKVSKELAASGSFEPFSVAELSSFKHSLRRPAFRLAQTYLVVFFCTMFLGLAYAKLTTCLFNHAKIEQMQNELNSLTSMAKFSAERFLKVEKARTVIHSFNPDLSPELQTAIANEIYAMSVKYENLDVELILATITHESAHTWDPRIVSPAGAIGLMQILPVTARHLLAEKRHHGRSLLDILFDPIQNIRLGCRYLSMLIQAYDVDGGLAAYNGGEKRAQKWLRQNRVSGILQEETETYVPAILKIYKDYQSM